VFLLMAIEPEGYCKRDFPQFFDIRGCAVCSNVESEPSGDVESDAAAGVPLLTGVASSSAERHVAGEQTIFNASAKLTALKASSDFRVDGPAVGVVTGATGITNGQLDAKVAGGGGLARFHETQTLQQAAECVVFSAKSAPIDVVC